MKLNRLFLIGTLGLAVSFSSCDKDDDDDDEMTNTQDQTFVMQAGMSNRAEIDMGTLASTKATNASVKNFAQMMITEHNKAQSDLQDVADDVDLPYTDSLDAENVALKQTLSGLSGVAFNRAYMQSQVAAHTKTLANFDAGLSGGSSQRVNLMLLSIAHTFRCIWTQQMQSITGLSNMLSVKGLTKNKKPSVCTEGLFLSLIKQNYL
jgi:putative membrane protein